MPKYLDYAGLQYYHEKLNLDLANMLMTDDDLDIILLNELGIVPPIPETWTESANGTLNLALGNAFSYWPEDAGTKTISITNGTTAGVLKFFLKLTDAGNFFVEWGSNIQWKNGSEPVWQAFNEDIIMFTSNDGGKTWVAQVVQTNAITPYWKVTVQTASNNKSIILPFNCENIKSIDWDDGNIDNYDYNYVEGISISHSYVSAYTPKHTYATSGSYKIIMRSEDFGYIQNWDVYYSGSQSEDYYQNSLISINSPLPTLAGSYVIPGSTVSAEDNSLEYIFAWCTQLASIPDKLFYNNPQCEIFGSAFWHCYSLTSLPESLFDKNVMATDFISCFGSCTSITSVSPKLFAKNTEAASFALCFSGCNSLLNFKLVISSERVSDFSSFISNASTDVTRILCVPANSTTYNSATLYVNSYNKVTVSTIDATCIPVFEYTVTTDVDYDYEDPNPDDNPLVAAVPLEVVQNATSNLTIDWGDGTAVKLAPTNLTESNLIHTYASAGTYHITVAASNWSDYKYRAVLYFWDSDPSSDDPILQTFRDKLISIDAPMPPIANTTLDYWFLACYNLVSIPSGLFDNVPSATSAISCFEKCYKLASIPSGLFDKNAAITSFSRCFLDCINVDGIPSGLFDNNTAVTDFSGCFRSCSNKVQSIPAGLFDNNTAATNFGDCFEDCMQLQSIPEGLFANNTAATNFRYCFSYCTQLQTIPGDLFANNTEATNFYKCFDNCRNIVNFTIHIGSSSVADAGTFIYAQRGTRIVYVPSNSTTYATFNAVASSLYLTIKTE